MAIFVLVHGAWGGAVIWRHVARALRDARHEVFAQSLTGLGERTHLLSRNVDLNCHIKDVLALIDYEDLDDIVLVGHSYGGMVVTGVADAVPDKVASLVYLDAFVPESGQALFDTIPPGMPRAAVVPGSEWLTAPLPVEAFGKPSNEALEYRKRKTGPHPTACFSQPLTFTGGIDRIRHKTYIYCNDPQPTTFTPFYERLKARPGWNVGTLPCTHMAPLDLPQDVVAMLLQAMPANP